MEIEYKKKIRRIYAKEKDGDILLVIPFSLKDDKKSLELGLQLVEKLKKKLSEEGLFDDNLTTTELIMELEDIIHYNWKRGRLGNWRIVDENLA